MAARLTDAHHGDTVFGDLIHPDKKIRFQYTTSSSSLQKKLGVA